jgi:plasma-membrane proton-efflux P-type ATPase
MSNPGPISGLSGAEAAARLSRDGPNEVAEKRTHPLARFAAKFWGVSAWMLELIVILSFLLHKTADLWVALALLLANAVIGFLQESRATSAIEALRSRMQVMARVLRDGNWQPIAARELVRGDVVRLRAGDFVPADVQLAEGQLRIDQSALTGESRDVARGNGETVHSGSIVRRGEATAHVTATGAATYFGRTTQLVASARPRLHVEAVIARVVKWLFLIVAGLVVAVAAVALAGGQHLLDILPIALVLLMSAVPVALPVMFTVSMAVGARELAGRGVLVTRLNAAEDAATMDVLCVDKTGTITINRLAVTGVIALGRATESEVLEAGALASQEADQDPIDLAFLAAARQRHAWPATPPGRQVSFAPFDAQSRRTEAIVEQDQRRLRVVKGAVRTVAACCGLGSSQIDALEARVADSAQAGYRTLAVGRGAEGGPLELLGLVTLYDPPRPDARELIAALRERGVAVKMLTGDALAVAGEVARQVGLARLLSVADLKSATAKSGEGQADLLAGCDGFAEVYPEDKFIVVRHLQAAGHVTGMTGDGVNDAPALRQAEVGIAVSTATDVAKAAASVVLTAPGLTNIVPLVEQGRAIYQRVLTWIVNKISRTILKSTFVAVAFIATGRFVISASAMLLLVFMTDFAKIALATDEVQPSKQPETWNVGGYVAVSVVLGLMMVAEALLFLWLGWSRLELAQHDGALYSFTFLTLLYFAVFSIVSVRARRWFWATKPGRVLAAALAADLVVGTAVTYSGLAGFSPLPVWQTLALIAYAMVACLAVNDAVKVVLIRRLTPATATR